MTQFFWDLMHGDDAILASMRKEKEQTINSLNFKITQLGFADGMELLTTLGT